MRAVKVHESNYLYTIFRMQWRWHLYSHSVYNLRVESETEHKWMLSYVNCILEKYSHLIYSCYKLQKLIEIQLSGKYFHNTVNFHYSQPYIMHAMSAHNFSFIVKVFVQARVQKMHVHRSMGNLYASDACPFLHFSYILYDK